MSDIFDEVERELNKPRRKMRSRIWFGVVVALIMLAAAAIAIHQTYLYYID